MSWISLLMYALALGVNVAAGVYLGKTIARLRCRIEDLEYAESVRCIRERLYGR